MIKNVIFDVMGVVFVVGDDTNDLLVPFVQRLNENISKEWVNSNYMDASLGKITSMEFWRRMGIDGSEAGSIEKKYLDENLKIDPNIIDFMKELKERGYRLGLLSNDVSEWGQYLREKFELNYLIDFCVISGDVKTRKPCKNIYQCLIIDYNLNPKESLFIDDRIKNLIPADKLGFKTILFNKEGNSSNCGNFYEAKDWTDILEILKEING